MTGKSKGWISWVFVGLFVGVALGWRPFARSMEQDAEAKRLLADVKRAEYSKENLIQQVGMLESVQGKEALARKHGWRKPEESVIR